MPEIQKETNFSPEIEIKPDLETLNKLALERVDRYQHLRVGRTFVNTPFFINQMQSWLFNSMQKANISDDQIENVMSGYGKTKEMPYAWYKGKGSPEELEQATKELAQQFGLDLNRATPEAAVEFMKYVGLGIDCSGFVTNVLDYAFRQDGLNLLEELDTFPHENGRRSKYRAGVSSYVNGKTHTIEPDTIGPLDLLIRKGWHDHAWHMGVILQTEDYLVLAHSTLGLTPNGVHTSRIRVENNKPIFSFKPNLSPVDWEEYYEKGDLEFRRLDILDDAKGRSELSWQRNRGKI